MTSSSPQSNTPTPEQQQLRREACARAVSHAIYAAIVLAQESGWLEGADALLPLACAAQKRYRAELERV